MGWENIWSNEIDPKACQVLRKNFNHEIIEALLTNNFSIKEFVPPVIYDDPGHHHRESEQVAKCRFGGGAFWSD